MTLVRVAHDHDDSVLVPLLRNIHASLEPGGVLLVAEPMAGVAQSRRVADVYFAFYLLAMGSGQPRSFERFRDLLRDAGFTDVRRVPTARPMLVSMLSARR
jgi:demethylspheroidene O-methyltransferase